MEKTIFETLIIALNVVRLVSLVILAYSVKQIMRSELLTEKKAMINDKIQHFIVGFVLSLTGFIFFPLILTGFIFGIGKELYDYISGKGVADWLDMVATFCGAVFASMIVIVLFL